MIEIMDEDNNNKTQLYKKSKEIIREQLIYELKQGNKYLKKKIGHFYSGLTGLILNPLVKTLYSWFIGPEITRDMIKQIDIMLDAAELLESVKDTPKEEEFWKKWIKKYCDCDPWLKRCNKNHPVYPEIIKMFEDGFKGSVTEFNRSLHTEAENYIELARKSFTKE